MNARHWVGLIFSVLFVMAGVATGAHYTQWTQLKELTYWLGVIMTLGGSGGLFATGWAMPQPGQRKESGP